jgi:hypothetical protein
MPDPKITINPGQLSMEIPPQTSTETNKISSEPARLASMHFSHSIVQITHSILKFLRIFSATEHIPTMGPPKTYAFDFQGKIIAKIFLWFRQLSASFGRL